MKQPHAQLPYPQADSPRRGLVVSLAPFLDGNHDLAPPHAKKDGGFSRYSISAVFSPFFVEFFSPL